MTSSNVQSSRTLVATGVFMWYSSERITNRYGAFYAATETYFNEVEDAFKFDRDRLSCFEGKRVKITARVVKGRPSGHVGDSILGLTPTPAAEGTEVEVGIGKLAIVTQDGLAFFELKPDDNRQHFWCDPRRFFQLHDQTCDFYVEETTDESHEVYAPGAILNNVGVHNADGVTFQLKTSSPPKSALEVKAYAVVSELGDGMFTIEKHPVMTGRMFEVKPES